MPGLNKNWRGGTLSGRDFFKREERKTLIFSFLSLLLGLGYAWGIFSSNAMLISRLGTGSLFYVYLGSSLAALILGGIFYGWVDRFPRRWVFFLSFEIFGTCILLLWFVSLSNPDSTVFYFAIRIFFYAVFILTTLEFWLLASDSFTNFEARVRYPYFIAFGVMGEMIGSFTIHQWASEFHVANFLLLWGLVLILSPLLLLKIRPPPSEISRTVSQGEPERKGVGFLSGAPVYASWLFSLLLIFWISHVFMAYGLDYLYNTSALIHFHQEDQLASFFGKVAIFSLLLVFLYQLFFATRLSIQFGIERSLWGLSALYLIGIGLVYFYPSLFSIAVAECLIFFFADLTAQSLLQPVNKVFPASIRGRLMVLVEALGFPGGTFLLFLVTLFVISLKSSGKMGLLLFVWALLFFCYPFFFGKAYLRYLLECLHSSEKTLVINVVHALGEPNKKKAAPALLNLLERSQDAHLQRAILLSLGRMQSREAFSKIVKYFSVPNELLQLAVLESLSHFRKEGLSALFRLFRSTENVSFQVRLNATILLTQLIGKKMRPFLLESLKEGSDRVKANAIESLALLKDRGIISVLLPYLGHENRRIRVNTAVALYPFRKIRSRALQTIESLFRSRTVMELFSAIYAVGELGLKKYQSELKSLEDSPDKRLGQHATMALAKMRDRDACEKMIRLLLDSEESFALETARHLGRFPPESRILVFEKISKLAPEEKSRIMTRLDQTPFDFSSEKELLISGGWELVYLPT